MNCLVTGGAGFIGSNLVDALVERGDQVTVIDDMSRGKRENLSGALERGATLHATDIRDPVAVASIFAVARPEVVFHLAAQVDVRRSVENPREDEITNVLGTINVLEAAREVGARRFVNSSTGGGLYGEAEKIPTPEDAPIEPLSPYGQSKYAAEGYCGLFARLYGLSTITLRYGNVYGPRQDIHGEAGVVAIFCGCLLAGRRPTIFGDGRQTRDWVYVADVVRANLAAADSSVTGAVNVGWGQESSVLDLIQVLNEVSDRRALPDPSFAPERPGEVRRSCLLVARAREQLGWAAEVRLPEGLRRVLEGL